MKSQKKELLLIITILFIVVFIISGRAVELIINDLDADYSDIGSWATAFNVCGYGGDYRFETALNDDDTAKWAASIDVNGTYDVFVHYCVNSARPQSVPYKISHAGGNSFVKVNQTIDAFGMSVPDFTASGFKYIGTFPFNTNGNQYIELNTSSVGDTVADAIMLSTGPYINNKSISSSCIFGNESIELFANISSPYCIGNVTFSVAYQNGANQNFSGVININPQTIHIGNYSVILSNLSASQIINWTVFVDDCFNNTVQNGLQSFYVNTRTILNVTLANPDGLNGWYISEPIFSLANSDASALLFKWDALVEQVYSGPFNMAGAPNNGSATGGVNILRYRANVSCGIEQEQNITIKADFKNPMIGNLIPTNGSIVYNNQKPVIEALLNDVFGSNSGINQSNISMLIDGSSVLFIINVSANSSNISLTVKHTPPFNLSIGIHNVTINVSDNAGRNSELMWFFVINTTNLFNMSIYFPFNGSFGAKQVQFNTTTTSLVKNISFINYHDVKPRFKILCNNCNQYGFLKKKTQSLHEGFNNITIRAIDMFGNINEEKISLFVDSKEPNIMDILPKRNAVINGSFFFIKYTEENLGNISLFFNPNITLSGCLSGINKNCSINVNLSSFNGQFIDFYFALSDVVRTVLSKVIEVKIDTDIPEMNVTAPINNQTFNTTQVQFNISISEKVNLEYMNLNESSPKFRNLCTNCDQYGKLNKKIVLFKKGSHNLLIRAKDKAGNADLEQINFTII